MKTEERILASGLRIVKVHLNSPVSHYQLYTPFGGDTLEYTDPDSGRQVSLPAGSAHYFEHVLFTMPPLGKDGKPIKYRTLTPKTKKGLRDGLTELENNGSIRTNAYTSAQITNYWFVTRENKEENLKTLIDFVLTPYLPEDRFRAEKGTIGDEIARDLNETGSRMFDLFDEQAYVDHSGKRTILGTKDSIAQIALEDVLSLHSTFYRPSNMTLIVTGSDDMDDLERIASEKLGELGKDSYLVPPQEFLQQDPDAVAKADNLADPLRRADVHRPKVLAGWKVRPDPSSMSADELIDFHVAAGIISQALYGKGTANREDLIRAGVDSRTLSGFPYTLRDRGALMVMADTDDPERFRDIITQNVEDIVRRGISDEEIEYARNSILMVEDDNLATILGIGNNLATWGGLTRNPLDYQKELKRDETMTASQVNSYLSRFFKPESFTMVLAEPEQAPSNHKSEVPPPEKG